MAGRAALLGLEAHAKHICITPDGHVFCYTCSKHWKEVALDGRSAGSKWLKGASNPLLGSSPVAVALDPGRSRRRTSRD